MEKLVPISFSINAQIERLYQKANTLNSSYMKKTLGKNTNLRKMDCLKKVENICWLEMDMSNTFECRLL